MLTVNYSFSLLLDISSYAYTRVHKKTKPQIYLEPRSRFEAQVREEPLRVGHSDDLTVVIQLQHGLGGPVQEVN